MFSPWQIERRYGFGAARLPLSPTPYRHPGDTPGLGGGVKDVWEDRGGLRGLVATCMPASVVLVALFAFVFQVSRGFQDESTIEIVAFEEPVELFAAEPLPIPEPPPVVELPEPVAPVEPEPVPVEVAALEPVPPPPVPVPPAPEPIVEPEPAPAPVVAIEPFVPEPEPLAAEPVRRAERAPRVRPEQLARVDVQPLPATLPDAEPAPSRAPRTFRMAAQTRARPQIQPTLAAPALAAPELRAPEPERRRTRRDPTRAVSPQVQQLALDAPAVPRDASSAPPAAPRSSRMARSRSAPTPARQPTLQMASLQAPAAAAPDPGARPAAAATRNARTAPRPQKQSRPSLAATALAPAALTRAREPSRPAPAPTRERRENRSQSAPAARSEPDSKLAGVPLGSLASCVSDRLEDSLKQKVMAAVTTGQECTNEAGRYRFLQTRNLNAFLMWIERAPTRETGDRCDELQRALDCLADRGRRESQQG